MSLLEEWAEAEDAAAAAAPAWATPGASAAAAEALFALDGDHDLGLGDDDGDDDAGGDGAPLAPLFAIETLEKDASHGGCITAVAAAANVVLLGTAAGALIRYDFAEGAATEVELGKPGATPGVHALFLDPSARHALVVLRDASGRGGGETLYAHASFRKARPVPKLRGCAPTAVAWHVGPGGATDAATREILLGSAAGALYELSLDASDKKEKLFRPLLELREREPVCGLHMEVTGGAGGGARFAVLAVTPSRLYFFAGGPSLEAAAQLAVSLAGAAGPEPVVELPGRLPAAALHVYGKPGRRADRFAWLAAQGVYHGGLAMGEGGGAGDDVAPQHRLLPYPAAPGTPASSPGPPPLSFAPTQHHFLLLYPDRLVALNVLSKRPAATISLARFGIGAGGPAALSLVPDVSGGALYLASAEGLFEVVTKDEGRDMWRLHLARREYGAALAAAPTPAAKERVHVAQGEAAFVAGDLRAAAAAFARAPRAMRFEDAALRLLGAGDAGALRAFLRARLDATPRADRAAATLLATWATELYLHALAAQPPGAADAAPPAAPETPPPAAARGKAAAAAAASAAPADTSLAAEFKAFLRDHGAALDVATTRRLLAEFGRTEELVFFADLRGDVATVVAHHLARGDAPRAVAVLRRPGVPPELHYSCAPRLFALAPRAAVDLWLAAGEALDPARLVPGLAAARRPGGDPLPGAPDAAQPAEQGLGEAARAEAVRYLEACAAEGCAAPAVHNLLLTLHAEAPRGAGAPDGASAGEAALLRYLRAAGAGGDAGGGAGVPLYDVSFALRTCLARGARRAAVELYVAAGALTEAVDLALTVDIELAKAVADKPGDDDEAARRALWLRVAAHVVRAAASDPGAAEAGEAAAIREAVAFLKETDGLLRIEDMLPFFPDSARIDDFRDAVCASLEEYNTQIAALRQEMADVTASADAIREDIAALAQRQLELPRDAACSRCSAPLASVVAAPAGAAAAGVPPFYVFPCGHGYEAGCLLEAACPLLGATQARAARRAWAALADGAPPPEGGPPGRATLEDALCAECPLCGEAAARAITTPFVDADAEAALVASWEI